MIDQQISRLIKPLLDQVATQLIRLGLSANAATSLAFLVGLSSAGLIALGYHLLGLGLLLVSRTLDGLDGAIARQTLVSDRGGFLDITFDFIFYASIPLAFALHDPNQNALAAATLLFAFIGTSSSFLAYASFAAKKKLSTPFKSIYFLEGFIESFETMIFFCLMCLMPEHFVFLAYLLALLSLITTIGRITNGYKNLKHTTN